MLLLEPAAARCSRPRQRRERGWEFYEEQTKARELANGDYRRRIRISFIRERTR